MKTIDKVLLWTGIILTPISAAWNGFVFTKLWAWFVVPQFGVQPITLLMAIGLGLTFNLLAGHTDTPKRESTDSEKFYILLTTVITALLRPALGLLIGYIVHRMM